MVYACVGETWSSDEVYPAMLDDNDMVRFRQGVDAVWRNSRLNQPLESMLRYCYANAGVISLRQSLLRCQVKATRFLQDLQVVVGSCVELALHLH